ncbi:hypothetical protein [Rhodococcus sp. IEGM 1366]|uniref:hypothetical protein n=1 Tax=Rhodococcus sp. IEGM 1366 TaxID=3082223 RepID=UPI0039896792
MSTDPRSPAALSGLADLRGWQEELYRDLHRHPKLSHQEHCTAGIFVKKSRAVGFSVDAGVDTGVVGVLRGGNGSAVLLRADMDPHPVLEATGLPYASIAIASGGDGGRGADHARLWSRCPRGVSARGCSVARRRERALERHRDRIVSTGGASRRWSTID